MKEDNNMDELVNGKFQFVSLGKNLLNQKAWLLIIKFMREELEHALASQGVDSISCLEDTSSFHICKSNEENSKGDIIFHVTNSVIKDLKSHNIREIFEEIETPIVTIGNSRITFWVNMTIFPDKVDFAITKEVAEHYSHWILDVKPDSFACSYSIPFFLFISCYIQGKHCIDIAFRDLQDFFSPERYSTFSDFERRILKPVKEDYDRAFEKGESEFTFTYKTKDTPPIGKKSSALINIELINAAPKKQHTPHINYNALQAMENNNKFSKYVQLLEANKNLILTGAPGTGKTCMAREIAKEFILSKVRLYNDYTEDEDFESDAEIEDFCNRILEDYCKMVQFHPSLDYTDFVEGLRPVKGHDSQLGFERKNGTFKDFCERALSFAVTKRRKDGSFIQNDVTISGWYDIYNDCYDIVIKEIQTCNTIYLVGDMDEDSFSVDIDGRNIIYNKIHWIDNRQESYELFYSLMGSDYNVFHNGYLSQPDIEKELFQLREHKIGSWERIKSNEEIKEISRFYCFLFMAFVDHAKKNYERINLPAVFIIDEINRGEISKIFGELFFSIDPGYRGEKGRVPTQYQNMVEEYDVFAKGFYVPENVYIIGTMNDIDRSVESMDFAMRRRFAFEEVTAEESYQNMIAESDDFNKDEKTEIKKRMLALNNAILKPELRLGEAYQIGAAYFRKYLYYKELGMEQAFTMLWKNHLKGLLFEYLRGNQNAEAQLEDLEKAYNQKAETHEETDSDNG